MDHLAATLKAAYPRALANLIGLIGDIDAAADAVQDAVVRELEVRRASGAPYSPVAWLVTNGRNKLIDGHRRQKLPGQYFAQVYMTTKEDSLSGDTSERAESRYADNDLLLLIFICCHPAQAQDAQVSRFWELLASVKSRENP